jgi:dTDP-glucose 4,6-dehydratase
LVRSYVNTHKINAVVTNCSNNYGPRQHAEKFIPTVISHINRRKPIPLYGTGTNIRDWLYVEDHCEALMLIGERNSDDGRYNIGGGVEMTNYQMAVTILDIMGLPVSDRWFKYVDDRPGHDLRYAMDYSKLTRDLGWMPRHNLITGLEKTLRWYNA